MSDDIPQTPAQREAQEKARVLQIPKLTERKPLAWGALEQRGEPPKREWAINNWLGMGHVTLLAGRGGMGKSILAQQIGSYLALGSEFLETVGEPRTVLGWFSEDDHDELWRRQCAIAGKLGQPLSAFAERLYLIPLQDAECTLFDTAPLSREVVRTSVLEELRQQIGDLGASIVILDNIRRLFGGNENNGHDVTSFIAALNYAASPTNAAVMLLGHVSRAQGSEFAGNMAWENAARMRWSFTDRPPDSVAQDEETPSDDTRRWLAKRKVNYTSRDLAILRWNQGAYDIEEKPNAAAGIMRTIDNRQCKLLLKRAFLRLCAMSYAPTDAATSPHYLVKLIQQHGLTEGFSKGELRRALLELIEDGVMLRNQEVGTLNNRMPRLGLKLGESPPDPV
jgi:RecA-family ATPase